MTGRAEQDGVVAADQAAAILRHHAAVFLVVLAAPVEMIDLELEAPLALGQRLQHLDAGGYHLGADSVAGNGGDPVGLHQRSPSRIAQASEAPMGENVRRSRGDYGDGALKRNIGPDAAGRIPLA